jgi:hypothetical protein
VRASIQLSHVRQICDVCEFPGRTVFLFVQDQFACVATQSTSPVTRDVDRATVLDFACTCLGREGDNITLPHHSNHTDCFFLEIRQYDGQARPNIAKGWWDLDPDHIDTLRAHKEILFLMVVPCRTLGSSTVDSLFCLRKHIKGSKGANNVGSHERMVREFASRDSMQ